jgi:hypothetical protein
MADWQRARGFDPTGVLTTSQREALVAGYRAAFAALGLSAVRDADAGIEIVLPLGQLARARTEAPFVLYDPVGGSGAQVLLISQTGDEATLFALYDLLQTLEIIPPTGPRERKRREFVIEGRSAERSAYALARLEGGAVKGFVYVWPPGGDPRLQARVLDAMKASFRSIPGVILPDTAVTGDGSGQRPDLLAGLEIRRPTRTRTGVFVDARGAVLTVAEAVAGCRKIVLADATEARVLAEDAALGLALLAPAAPLAPLAVAGFQDRRPRIGSEVAVAGFAWGDALDLPVLTFGRLADIRGLDGDPDRQRLDLAPQPGDAGGPVLDQTGAVVGLLLPPAPGETRVLPEGVSFAAPAPGIAAFLAGAGIAPAPATGATALAPEDIARLGADLAVRVSCWE